jgi:NAD(P)-dependent dehydrogenase (short-subunit alcohol dehydrogenase family)
MKGKTVVITGATSGIGQIASEQLAAMGARIVFVARDPSRGEATLARLRERSPGIDHRAHYADLSRLADMKRVALEISSSEPRIDVLMNNAGAMFGSLLTTEDNLEMTFALNHMSYFVMTYLLRERLIATPGARIVNTSSEAHRNAKVDYGDLQMKARFGMFRNYCLSKLYNILFTRELPRQWRDAGIVVNALHPGFVATRFGDETSGAAAAGFRFLKRFAISPEDGAQTMVFLASSPQAAETSGEYFQKCTPSKPSNAALDDKAGRWLWSESERIAGFHS